MTDNRHRERIAFPVYPNWIFERLRRAGYRPRQMPNSKYDDVLVGQQRLTLQLPKKHEGIQPAIIRDVIKVKGFLHVSECRIRKNTKWIGVTIILQRDGLKDTGR